VQGRQPNGSLVNGDLFSVSRRHDRVHLAANRRDAVIFFQRPANKPAGARLVFIVLFRHRSLLAHATHSFDIGVRLRAGPS
jgi:hypothetical protein